MLTLHFSQAKSNEPRSAYGGMIFSDPIEDALAEMRSDIATLRAIAPEAQAIPALERYSKAFGEALQRARRPDGVLTVEELARIERVSKQALRRRLEKGQYPGAEKRGGVWRIPKEALGRAA